MKLESATGAALSAQRSVYSTGPRIAERQGLEVTETMPAGMAVLIGAGWLRTADGAEFGLDRDMVLPIRPGGVKRFDKQTYHIHGEATCGPLGFHTEGIRGSGGEPYSRMVPGTLAVYDAERGVRYEEGRDYVADPYWGSIKAHPDGRIAQGEQLSLDYDVFLCRYDAVVLDAQGMVALVEGEDTPPELRELLLPDPPEVKEGIVLAHVFTGWGNVAVTSGSAVVRAGVSADVIGHYLDMVPRTFVAEITESGPDGFTALLGASGEDYETCATAAEESCRKTAPIRIQAGAALPLLDQTAHGMAAEWGLSLRLDAAPPAGTTIAVDVQPQMIFPLARPGAPAAADVIPRRGFERLARTMGKLSRGERLNIVFFGESTTGSGRWPYLLRDALRGLSGSSVITVNAGKGGENSIRGLPRLEGEVLSREPDLVIVEYQINDSCTNRPDEVESAMRAIARRIRETGSDCLIVTNNGMNPLYGISRLFDDINAIYSRIAEEEGCAFAGCHELFKRLHEFGRYFLTELKGNMINHPYGNMDPDWGDFDKALAEALAQGIRERLQEQDQ